MCVLVQLLCFIFVTYTSPAAGTKVAAGEPELLDPAHIELFDSRPGDVCERFDNEVVDRHAPSLLLKGKPWNLTATYGAAQNNHGINGRKTQFDFCFFPPTNTGSIGWNWSRGVTSTECAVCDLCGGSDKCGKSSCLYDFSFLSLDYGVSLKTGRGTGNGQTKMPIDVSKAKWINVSLDVSVWAHDENPAPARAAYKFIFDMYLTKDRPGKGDVSGSLTDEVLISLDYNPGFPTTPCSDSPPFPGTTFSDGYDQYEYYWAGHNDSIGSHSGFRYSTFRRTKANTALPPVVNILPFLTAIKKQWAPVTHDALGPWLGLVQIGMVIFDHTHGTVTFRSVPQFAVDYHTSTLDTLVI